LKVALIGGGGPRTIYFTESLLKYSKRLGITELCLMDNDDRKLSAFGGICRALANDFAKNNNNPVTVTLENDFRRAVCGTKAVVFAIRAGGDDARVNDEKIALSFGLIGQETTGAGGFAYAMRTIPVMIEYLRILHETAPEAIAFNFTNPAGLVTQALCDAGFKNIYGICDNATGIKIELSKVLGISSADLKVNAYGLNHLSWVNAVRLGGTNILPELLSSQAFIDNFKLFAYFDRDIIKYLGEIPNGYLFYYYHREKALANMLKSPKTRGESIRDINRIMLEELSVLDVEKNPDTALEIFRRRMEEREGSYMKMEMDGLKKHAGLDPASYNFNFIDRKTDESGRNPAGGPLPVPEAIEGYAGVAFNCMESLWHSGKSIDVALNLPNNGAIEGMESDDVVEVSCDVDETGVKPLQFTGIPHSNFLLMKTIKRYEKLAIKAIRERRREYAYEALTIHPLVSSYSLAKCLVDKYCEANNARDWK